MPKKTTKKRPYKLLKKDYAERPEGWDDMIVYSFHPHTPVDMIYYKVTKDDLICTSAGADVEDHIEPIRKKLKKCLF